MLSALELAAINDHPCIDVEIVRRGGLSAFVAAAWSQVESSPMVWGWHLDEICAHLEAVSRGEIRRLIINEPPGCSKSLITSVFWPTWDWLNRPARKWMFSTFDASLARRDALRCRGLIASQWFQDRWPQLAIGNDPDQQRTMGVYYTTGGGFRFSTSVGGGATGWHSHIQVVDDPTKPKDVQAGGDVAREALRRTETWWKQTMASRKADPQDFSRVIIMQRLHEDDLAGSCLREGGWEHLCLPMRYDETTRCVTSVGGDRRTVPGELLCPARFSEEAVAETERDMGPQVASAQLQQRPAPAKGLIFDRAWLANEYGPKDLPSNATWVQSWDCAFKDLSTSDYVVGQVWCCVGARFYLVDQVRAHLGFDATRAAIIDMTIKWPQATTFLIEDKANGTAIVETLKKDFSGVIAVNPQGGKVARANAVSPLFAANDVFVPKAEHAPWINAWREEMASFPMARHDDSVDATTQALTYMHEQDVSEFITAMRAAKGRR